tara:strand:- start:1464 stop:2108 length:645 start_codon:yes stop_codon:yes gene_type:complete
MNIRDITDVHNILYINLDHRTDRKEMAEKEFDKIGVKGVQRFSAIKCEKGAIGCTKSHIECLRIALDKGWDHIMIFEDDIEFTDPGTFIKKFNRFVSSGIPWDVVLLSGNIIHPYTKMNSSCVRIVGGCQTTGAYFVSGKYIPTLLKNFEEGLSKLIEDPTNTLEYAIDRHWINLQRQHNWYIIIPLTVTQREGYSDIEKKKVSYTKMILNIDK